MECKQILTLIFQGKLEKDIAAYYDCFLSVQHFLRFKLALDLRINSVMVNEYLFLDLGYNRPFSFIAGIDDTTKKIFAIPVRSCYVRDEDDEKEIRDCMGFDYHYYENFEYKDKISVRLQGDLIMDIIKVFNSKEELLEYTDKNRESYRQIWENFIRSQLNNDEDVKNAEILIGSYQELMEFVLRMDDVEDIKRALRNVRLVEKSIIDMAKKFEIKLHNIYERPFSFERRRYKCIRFIDVQDFQRKIIDKKITYLEGKFKDYILNSSSDMKIRIGHYTTPHEVYLRGIITEIDNDRTTNNRRAGLIIFEPQRIVIEHPEHGTNYFYIPKPSYVKLRLMQDARSFERF